MALAGQAFLALWNDITSTREVEYDQWHTLEHVPERVSVEGFHGARRYVNRGRTEHRYFTLYDVAQIEVFECPEYRDLIENPTPWTSAMRSDFSNFIRATCTVSLSQGSGIGAAIACLCVATDVDDDKLKLALARASGASGVNAVHLGKYQKVPTSIPFKSPPPGVASQREFDRVSLIETLDRATAEDVLGTLRSELAMHHIPVDFGADVYDLAFVFPAAGDPERRRHRRRTWAG